MHVRFIEWLGEAQLVRPLASEDTTLTGFAKSYSDEGLVVACVVDVEYVSQAQRIKLDYMQGGRNH